MFVSFYFTMSSLVETKKRKEVECDSELCFHYFQCVHRFSAFNINFVTKVFNHFTFIVLRNTKFCSFVCTRGKATVQTYLEKTSLSSCSETNCPRLATNNVEQGAFAANGGLLG